MSHIGLPVREHEIQEPAIIPEREEREIERREETPVPEREKEKEKVPAQVYNVLDFGATEGA